MEQLCRRLKVGEKIRIDDFFWINEVLIWLRKFTVYPIFTENVGPLTGCSVSDWSRFSVGQSVSPSMVPVFRSIGVKLPPVEIPEYEEV